MHMVENKIILISPSYDYPVLKEVKFYYK